MAYELFHWRIYLCSWSLRAWLLFDRFDISVNTRMIAFDGSPVADQMTVRAPARTVPTLCTEDGAIISDSLAIAEEMANRHPDAGIWPTDPLARATARTLAAEMHSSFVALRANCPMNLRLAYSGYEPVPEVLANLQRIEAIWDHARRACGGEGPWLCGTYSAADAFFAPIAARIAGYGLPVSDAAWAYVGMHLADPNLRRWRAMGLVAGAELPQYARNFETVEWPGPEPLTARAAASGPSENKTCPYSGRQVAHFLQVEGRVFGFCNAFCRDKTVADPAAWPAFMQLLEGPLS